MKIFRPDMVNLLGERAINKNFQIFSQITHSNTNQLIISNWIQKPTIIYNNKKGVNFSNIIANKALQIQAKTKFIYTCEDLNKFLFINNQDHQKQNLDQTYNREKKDSIKIQNEKEIHFVILDTLQNWSDKEIISAFKMFEKKLRNQTQKQYKFWIIINYQQLIRNKQKQQLIQQLSRNCWVNFQEQAQNIKQEYTDLLYLEMEDFLKNMQYNEKGSESQTNHQISSSKNSINTFNRQSQKNILQQQQKSSQDLNIGENQNLYYYNQQSSIWDFGSATSIYAFGQNPWQIKAPKSENIQLPQYPRYNDFLFRKELTSQNLQTKLSKQVQYTLKKTKKFIELNIQNSPKAKSKTNITTEQNLKPEQNEEILQKSYQKQLDQFFYYTEQNQSIEESEENQEFSDSSSLEQLLDEENSCEQINAQSQILNQDNDDENQIQFTKTNQNQKNSELQQITSTEQLNFQSQIYNNKKMSEPAFMNQLQQQQNQGDSISSNNNENNNNKNNDIKNNNNKQNNNDSHDFVSQQIIDSSNMLSLNQSGYSSFQQDNDYDTEREIEIESQQLSDFDSEDTYNSPGQFQLFELLIKNEVLQFNNLLYKIKNDLQNMEKFIINTGLKCLPIEYQNNYNDLIQGITPSSWLQEMNCEYSQQEHTQKVVFTDFVMHFLQKYEFLNELIHQRNGKMFKILDLSKLFNPFQLIINQIWSASIEYQQPIYQLKVMLEFLDDQDIQQYQFDRHGIQACGMQMYEGVLNSNNQQLEDPKPREFYYKFHPFRIYIMPVTYLKCVFTLEQ
ncbi:hypothetical protein PPERSA_12540 [Pseudocohnilembus persalinus]|uniref:Uncharacterized protein n=1 Tax=Pseudocohnilembus persalinus TaxID=266149 RepID=A0A0V0QB09_PSEPJ|nr:hypothetical protein PPERSA_12540 [Pseudocohnilembus persalinus]|eukprot:KRW99436.1 hypothetical protein PPERSA_12540 [Pseudocohnilembus persalinus]